MYCYVAVYYIAIYVHGKRRRRRKKKFKNDVTIMTVFSVHINIFRFSLSSILLLLFVRVIGSIFFFVLFQLFRINQANSQLYKYQHKPPSFACPHLYSARLFALCYYYFYVTFFLVWIISIFNIIVILFGAHTHFSREEFVVRMLSVR